MDRIAHRAFQPIAALHAVEFHVPDLRLNHAAPATRTVCPPRSRGPGTLERHHGFDLETGVASRLTITNPAVRRVGSGGCPTSATSKSPQAVHSEPHSRCAPLGAPAGTMASSDSRDGSASPLDCPDSSHRDHRTRLRGSPLISLKQMISGTRGHDRGHSHMHRARLNWLRHRLGASAEQDRPL